MAHRPRGIRTAACRGTESPGVVLQRSGSKFVEAPKNICARGCCRVDRTEELLWNVRGIVVAPRERFISQPFRRVRPTLSFSPLLSQQPGGSLFAALRLPILYAAPHFKDEFARNFFFFASSSSFPYSSFFSFFFHEHPCLAVPPSSRRREKLRREKRLRLIEIEFYSSAVHFINAEKKLFCKAFTARYVSTPSFFRFVRE